MDRIVQTPIPPEKLAGLRDALREGPVIFKATGRKVERTGKGNLVVRLRAHSTIRYGRTDYALAYRCAAGIDEAKPSSRKAQPSGDPAKYGECPF